MKKIHCKHGLNAKEEIQARRLKTSVLEGEERYFEERLKKVFNVYKTKRNESFYEYILNNDKVLYSVFERIGGIKKMYYYLEKYNLL